MRKCLSILALGAGLVVAGGCSKKPQTDYSGLDQSGMWSSSLEELKKLKVSDVEISQLTKLKQTGASDDLCLSLLKAARAHHHDFSSAEAAMNLSRAGYSDAEILEMAQTDQIDILAGEAVMHRRMQGLPTPTSAQIGRLKNTGFSERQILEYADQGHSNEQIEVFIHQREVLRNHANTGFVRVQGRRR